MTRRLRLLPVLIAAGALAAGAGSAGARGLGSGAGRLSATGATGATGSSAPELAATLSACHTDPLAANRYATFASQTLAAAVPGTITMAVAFKLQERTSGTRFTLVKASGFETWVSSEPHIGIFTYSHEVTALPAPAAFRVLVKARWIGHHHRILHATEAFSPVCIEPALAPDLVVGRVVRVPGGGAGAGTSQYQVEVRNAGNAAAGPFGVSLAIGGTTLAPVTISGLAAGAVAPATFIGPACGSGTTLTAAADPSGQIPEPADTRRSLTLDCPLP